jgi:hypothetical protein
MITYKCNVRIFLTPHLLKYYVINVTVLTGNIPTVSKLMCITGYNAYLNCRFYYLKGVYSVESRYVYYLYFIPRTSNIMDFDLKELLKCTENNFLNNISKIINETNKTTRVLYIKETGIINFIYINFI